MLCCYIMLCKIQIVWTVLIEISNKSAPSCERKWHGVWMWTFCGYCGPIKHLQWIEYLKELSAFAFC